MAAVDLDRIGRASLKELGDIRIDDVLSFIDRGIENMPSYMDLYRRWESQQWAVADIDFTLDRQDWLESTDLDRKATLWSHRLFFNGEERVTATLAPFVWAAPTPEIEVFLSTQMVDEARHTGGRVAPRGKLTLEIFGDVQEDARALESKIIFEGCEGR